MRSDEAVSTSPPRAPVAFRVGIVGHRPNRLPGDEDSLAVIAGRLRDLLHDVRVATTAYATGASLYSDEAPRLLAVSPLAEGTDRMFARVALDLGYGLNVPMPFLQAEYEKDFAGDDGRSLGAFRGLLERAGGEGRLSRFELEGDRADPAAAYGAAGRLVVNQSDLLIVVWDGKVAQGGGGTVDTIREALRYQVPVIWVDAHAPFGWKKLRHAADMHASKQGMVDAETMAELIHGIVADELALPADLAEMPGHHASSQTQLATGYFEERRPAMNWHFLWKTFRNWMSGQGAVLPRALTRDFIAATKDEADCPTDPALLVHFAWADKLADRYADAHRSVVIWASMLSAVAVFLGLALVAFGLADHDHLALQGAFAVTELFVVLGLYCLARRARKRHYHDKWLEYRMLAEWIRQLCFMAPLGGGRPLLRSRAHLSVYGEPTRSWMYWHVRAITRAHALPDTIADRAHAAACLDGLSQTIAGQIAFHDTTRERCERIQHRLHRWLATIVLATALGVAAHVLILSWEWIGGAPHGEPASHGKAVAKRIMDGVLILLAAFLPAAGAALANINNQGEFTRLGKRAQAMRDSFLRLGEEADGIGRRVADSGSQDTMARTTRLASRMAATMLEEVIDWRIVVLDLPQGVE